MKTKNIIKLIFLSCLGVGSLTSCLDLDEELYGRLSPETYYQTEEEALSSVVGVYSYLSYMSRAGGDGWRIGEFGTDEFFCPGRASGGWYDEGNMEMMSHKVTPNNERIATCWGTYVFPGIGAANAVMASLEASPIVESLKPLIAEVRALRAYGYYYAMDYWGNVPVLLRLVLIPIICLKRLLVQKFLNLSWMNLLKQQRIYLLLKRLIKQITILV